MCDVPRCGSWSMQINQLPKQNLSWLALAGAHRSQNSVAVFWPEVEEVPSVLTPGPALFLTKFSHPGLPSEASPAHPRPAFPKLFCIRIPLGQWLLHLKKKKLYPTVRNTFYTVVQYTQTHTHTHSHTDTGSAVSQGPSRRQNPSEWFE